MLGSHQGLIGAFGCVMGTPAAESSLPNGRRQLKLVRVLMLWLAIVPCVMAPQRAAAQSSPEPPTKVGQTRGVAGHIASETAIEQLPSNASNEICDAAVARAAGTSTPPSCIGRGILFRITPPAASNSVARAPSYLFGTIHFGTSREQAVDYAALTGLLHGVDTYINEVDVKSPWLPDYDQYRWLPADQSLSELIGADSMQRAGALLPKIRPNDLGRMKPWLVLALLEARGETDGDSTMDAHLQTGAVAAGKQMVHLETLGQQLQALDCVSAKQQAVVLGERLRKSWVLRVESAQAMGFYRSRNLDAWLASVDRMDGLDAAAKVIESQARRCLLEDRNQRWLGQIEAQVLAQPSFVAVGALHLAGAKGLIHQLRQDGFNVVAWPLPSALEAAPGTAGSGNR